jgi:hypothetical protein
VGVDDYRFFTPALDLLLRPIGSRDTAVKSWQVEKKTNQANAAGSDCATDHMEGQHEAVEERQSGTAGQALGHMSPDIEAGVP